MKNVGSFLNFCRRFKRAAPLFWRGPVVALCAFVGMLALSSYLDYGADGETGIVLDAEISAGSVIEVFFNSDWYRPSRMSIHPGKRMKYRILYQRPFPSYLLPAPITNLRVDFTDSPKATVTLHSIKVFDLGEQKLIRGGDMLSVASLFGIRAESNEGEASSRGALRLTAETYDPIVLLPVSLENKSFSLDIKSFSSIKSVLSLLMKQLLPVGLCFCFLVIGGLELWTRGFLSWIVNWLLPFILIGGALFAFPIIPIDSVVPSRYHSVDLSVGNAAFNGYPKGSDFATIYWYVFISVVSGCLCAVVSRLLLQERDLGCSSSEEKLDSRWNSMGWWLLLVISLIGVVRSGSFAFQNLRSPGIGLDYDTLNIETWNYLYQVGFRPFLDFWYPYGFSIFTSGRSPQANFSLLLHNGVLYTVLGGSLFLLFGRRWGWALATVGFTLIFEVEGIFNSTHRYLIALNLVLFLGALLLNRSSIWMGFAYGIFGAYCLIFEPSQSFYALPGCFIVALYTFVVLRGERQLLWARFRPLLLGVLVGGAIVCGFTIYLSFTGQLSGLVRVYSRLGSTVVYAAVPGHIADWISSPFTAEGGVLVGNLTLLALGIFSVLSLRPGRRRDLSVVVLALSVVTLCIFHKYLVRPHMSKQFLVLVFVGAVIFVRSCRDSWTRGQVLVGYAFVGMLVFDFSSSGRLREVQEISSRAPRMLAEAVTLLSIPRDEVRNAYEYFFSQDRLARIYPVIRAFAQLREENGRERGVAPNFFVLGDEAYLYNVFRQKPPPFISLYNSSDVRDQLDIVDWLDREQPLLVVWNSKALSFDGVPNVVRTPLLFRYVMDHYRRIQTAEGFWFLVRHDTRTERFEWEDSLGRELDLGAIPALSEIGLFPDCVSNQEGCRSVVRLSLSEPSQSDTRRFCIRVRFRERDYKVWLTPLGKEAFIRLDRLWFLPTDFRAEEVEVAAEQPNHGFSVAVERRSLPSTLLY